MLRTRLVNDWLGTNHTMEEVAEMDWTLFEIMAAEKHAIMTKE